MRGERQKEARVHHWLVNTPWGPWGAVLGQGKKQDVATNLPKGGVRSLGSQPNPTLRPLSLHHWLVPVKSQPDGGITSGLYSKSVPQVKGGMQSDRIRCPSLLAGVL